MKAPVGLLLFRIRYLRAVFVFFGGFYSFWRLNIDRYIFYRDRKDKKILVMEVSNCLQRKRFDIYAYIMTDR